MTRQEMFDRAVRGLRSQGFERSVKVMLDNTPCCVYADGTGKRCAWGWVDPEGTSDLRVTPLATVHWLKARGIGVAGTLPDDDLEWAAVLQMTHDRADSPSSVESRLREFARHWMLTWPED